MMQVCASVKRDLCVWHKRPMCMAKETYVYGKRGRPTCAYARVTQRRVSTGVKSDLSVWHRRPTNMRTPADPRGGHGRGGHGDFGIHQVPARTRGRVPSLPTAVSAGTDSQKNPLDMPIGRKYARAVTYQNVHHRHRFSRRPSTVPV